MTTLDRVASDPKPTTINWAVVTFLLSVAILSVAILSTLAGSGSDFLMSSPDLYGGFALS